MAHFRLFFICLLIATNANLLHSQNMVFNADFEEITQDIQEPSSYFSNHYFIFKKKGYLNSIIPHWYNIYADAPYIVDGDVKKSPHQLGYPLDILPENGRIMLAFNTHSDLNGGTLIYTKLRVKTEKGKNYIISCSKSNSIYSKYSSHQIHFKFTNYPKQIIENELDETFEILQSENEPELKTWKHLAKTHQTDSSYAYLVIGSRYIPSDFLPSNTKVPGKHTTSTALYYIDDVKVILGTTPKEVLPTPVVVKKEAPILIKKFTLESINFQHNSSDLDDDSQRFLKDFYKKISHLNIEELSIDGFTNAKGTTEYNQKLSLKRALAVYNYFNILGIQKEIMTYEGHGETGLIDKENPNSGKNRRVEIIIKHQ